MKELEVICFWLFFMSSNTNNMHIYVFFVHKILFYYKISIPLHSF